MKRILALIILFLLLIAPAPISAQDGHQDNVNDMDPSAGANIARFNLDSINTFWSAAGCTVATEGCVKENGETLLSTSAVTATSEQLATIITTPPVNTATYVADILQNSGFAQPAYAQGVGFSSLSPVLQVWKAFRDISYFFFIIIFVAIGFMIMIRKKISSNAVLTIQEALPKIVLTLLLITFSYAIAGLLIDLMYLSILAITGVFETVGILEPGGAKTAQNILFGRNIIGIGWNNFMGPNDVAGTAAEELGELVKQTLGFGKIIANSLGYLIIAVAIFIALFRTLFQLIIAYVSIILSVVLAPFRLLLNAMPGSNAFSGWFMGLLANILVFPAVAVMILLGVYLGGNPSANPDSNELIPVVITSENDGLLPPFIATRGEGSSNVRAIIGLGIILMLPEVVKMVKEALQVKESDLFGAAFKNAQAGMQHGPAAWVGGGAKWAGNLATGTLTQAGASIASRYISNWGPIAAIQRRAMTGEAHHAAAAEDAKIEELKRIRAGRRASQSNNTPPPPAPKPPSSGSLGTPPTSA
jgi:hypothetical protein